MSVEATVQRIWNEERPENRTAPLRAGLCFLSLPYCAAVAMKNRLYDHGIFRQEKLPCPIVSVGNLTVGGTGKTPTVILLANLLREKGRRPVVLSRGYGGNAKAPVNIVSDGNRLLMGWREAGDEPVLIAKSAPGVPVLTGPKRFLTGRVAVEHFGADVLILDDGFQHRALFRNLDILLVDAALPFGNGFLLPRGPLREPQEALSRAHLVIRTGGSGETEQPLPGAPSLPSFRGIHRPQGLVEAGTDRALSLAELQGKKVCAFSGIASPEAFRRSLTVLGAAVVAFRAFPDHHPYGPSDLDALRRLAGESGAKRIVTTEKDGVRLADFPVFLAEVSLLRIGMEITPAEPFAELIFSGLAGHSSRPSRGICNHEA
ncbi:MAG: tetraacyldisaccharide 4'-kinase [Proteobacteria bacterium]|nr:tetraacyldisaccharide 4'-kinase [Pseudomonadota bacterium]